MLMSKNVNNDVSKDSPIESLFLLPKLLLRTVPTLVIAHTFCASPDTRISYRQFLLIQGIFLRGLRLSGESRS